MTVKASRHRGASVPHGKRIYAVGDIHGRLDLLDRLLHLIQSDSKADGAAETLLVFLGDYVDRGPDSAGVVSRLISGLPDGLTPVFLKGNHEDMLLAFLDEPGSGLNWMYNGGDAALLSYGTPLDIIQDAFFQGWAGLLEANAAFRELLPDDHLQFLPELETQLPHRRILFRPCRRQAWHSARPPGRARPDLDTRRVPGTIRTISGLSSYMATRRRTPQKTVTTGSASTRLRSARAGSRRLRLKARAAGSCRLERADASCRSAGSARSIWGRRNLNRLSASFPELFKKCYALPAGFLLLAHLFLSWCPIRSAIRAIG